MKKRIPCITMALVPMLSLSVNAFAEQSEVPVVIDNEEVRFTDNSGRPFVDKNGRTQVPHRVAMEQYGCRVQWDGENSCAVITKDGATVIVPIGERYIIADGERIPMDTAALAQNGRTYLPTRCVLEAFGADVKWENGTVSVASSAPDDSKEVKKRIEACADTWAAGPKDSATLENDDTLICNGKEYAPGTLRFGVQTSSNGDVLHIFSEDSSVGSLFEVETGEMFGEYAGRAYCRGLTLERIELTAENFFEYFELAERPEWRYNVYGEFDGLYIYRGLRSRDAYRERLDKASSKITGMKAFTVGYGVSIIQLIRRARPIR